MVPPVLCDLNENSFAELSVDRKKWDDLFEDFLVPLSIEVTEQLRPSVSDVTLDIAWGTGTDGLTIASTLNKLKNHSAQLCRTNPSSTTVKYRSGNEDHFAGNIYRLPFKDNMFDIISCRLGFMYFPDLQLTVKELFRVLKPRGSIAISFWVVPEKNFWVTSIMGRLNISLGLGLPIPKVPETFGYAGDGLVSSVLSHAGLKNVSIKRIFGRMYCNTSELYWKMMTEAVAGPYVTALSNADLAKKEKANNAVYELLNHKYPGGNVNTTSNALIIYGKK